jgi:hypothetical protein
MVPDKFSFAAALKRGRPYLLLVFRSRTILITFFQTLSGIETFPIYHSWMIVIPYRLWNGVGED